MKTTTPRLRVLRKPEVMQMTSLPNSTMSDLERRGEFPKRFALSDTGMMVGWYEHEIIEWLEKRASKRSNRVGPHFYIDKNLKRVNTP